MAIFKFLPRVEFAHLSSSSSHPLSFLRLLAPLFAFSWSYGEPYVALSTLDIHVEVRSRANKPIDDISAANQWSFRLCRFAGEAQVKYIYLRYRFEWNEKMYSLLTMCDTLALTIGENSFPTTIVELFRIRGYELRSPITRTDFQFQVFYFHQ